MVWLLSSLTAIIGILLAWGNYKICNLKRDLNMANRDLHHFSIENFREIQIHYVKGDDILAGVQAVDGRFVHCAHTNQWLGEFHSERNGDDSSDNNKFNKGHGTAVLIKVYKSIVTNRNLRMCGIVEVLEWVEEKDLRWTALREFVNSLRKDLAYEDPMKVSGSWPEARVSDLALLLGDKAELEIVRILGGATDCKKEVFEKMKRIRKLIDVRKRAGDVDRHFEFLMSKNVGFDKDRRIVDLIDDDQMLEKVCNCFQELEKKV